jgi:hypothetical protein
VTCDKGDATHNEDEGLQGREGGVREGDQQMKKKERKQTNELAAASRLTR